jgi:hypothetical protein
MYNDNDAARDEFIYTKLFNNNAIPIEISIDFSIGSLNEWITTCNKFNNGEKILSFALIYIVKDKLVCNNLHPFSKENLHPFLQNLHPFSKENMHPFSKEILHPFSQIDYITDLIHTHKIND